MHTQMHIPSWHQEVKTKFKKTQPTQRFGRPN
jgi:hypothetical protein